MPHRVDLLVPPDPVPVDQGEAARQGRPPVEVADRGPGPLPGEVRRGFDTLYRGRAVAERGAGLALCRGLVEAPYAQPSGEGVAFRFTPAVRDASPRVPGADA